MVANFHQDNDGPDPIDGILASCPDLVADLNSDHDVLHIRALRSIFSQLRQISDEYDSHSEPDSPCSLMPGTPEKIDLMAERVGNRKSAFHPSDRRRADTEQSDSEKHPDLKRNGAHCKNTPRRFREGGHA